MKPAVDLTNLNDMIGDDSNLRAELFKEFIKSSEESLAILHASCHEAAQETWRKESHSMKGISLNLGAEALGELCKMAQEHYTDTAAAKHGLLSQIEIEYFRVKDFLLAEDVSRGDHKL